MSTTDIDCAHHIGAVTAKGKQTLLVRFFSHDLANDCMKHARNLRGTGLIVYEDCPLLNRTLISNLKERDDVHAVWCANGTIWVRLTPDGKKFKISIADNAEETLNEQKLANLKNPQRPTSSRNSLVMNTKL